MSFPVEEGGKQTGLREDDDPILDVLSLPPPHQGTCSGGRKLYRSEVGRASLCLRGDSDVGAAI